MKSLFKVYNVSMAGLGREPKAFNSFCGAMLSVRTYGECLGDAGEMRGRGVCPRHAKHVLWNVWKEFLNVLCYLAEEYLLPAFKRI